MMKSQADCKGPAWFMGKRMFRHLLEIRQIITLSSTVPLTPSLNLGQGTANKNG